MARVCLLPDRSVFEIAGSEAKTFLQDLLTNNLDLVSPTRAIYTCLLTPQGKYLFDFFLVEKNGAYLVECDREAAPHLLKRLMFYKLRADVTLRDLGRAWTVGAVIGDEKDDEPGTALPLAGGVRFQDPRLGALGTRFLVPDENTDNALNEISGETMQPADYERHRLTLGVPGRNDLVPDKTFPLEANLDTLNAIDFHKGCFVGQEVTSRTHRQGKVRKRILPIRSNAPFKRANPVMAGDRQAGEVLSTHGQDALALLRLDRLGDELSVDGTHLEVRFPDWLPRPSEEKNKI